jgi:hypothetical protein
LERFMTSPSARRPIDFDFYRRDAARRRTRMQRRAMRAIAAAMVDLWRGALTPSIGAPRPRLLWRKRFG